MSNIIIGAVILIIICFLLFKPIKIKKQPLKIIDNPPPRVKLTETYLTLENYIGQSKNIDYLKGHIDLAKRKEKALPHIVLWGSGGLGKSTLIKSIANEMGGRFIEIIPANLKTTKDLFNVLLYKVCFCYRINPYNVTKCLNCNTSLSINFVPQVKLKHKDILFFEECHGLRTDIEEALYSLMQDEYLMVRYSGMDRMVEFPNITIAGATTRLGDLNKPFRDRFKINIKLDSYSSEEIKTISKMYCEHKGYEINEEALENISSISYGVPRIAKKYIDDAYTRGHPITKDKIEKILELLEIDEHGLDKIHRSILNYIHIRGQAGDTSIAGSTGIPKEIYLEVYEPALFYKEFIFQGSRGRMLTPKSKEIYFKDCECKKCQ